MYKTKFFLVLGLCAVLSACADRNIVNKIELAQTLGLDSVRNGIKSAVLIARYKERGQTELRLMDTASNSIYDIIPRLNTKTKAPVEYGQLKMVLFGKKYSEKGIIAEIHSLGRDPKISTRLQLGVADRDASELLEMIQKSQEPFFLSDMIEQNRKNGNLPLMNLHVLLFNLYGQGRDLFLPYFKIERGKIKIDGLALFRNDKKITEISIRDAFLLKILIENSKNGSYMVPIAGRTSNQNPENFVLLRSINSKAKYIVNRVEPIPSITIRISMQAVVANIPNWIDLRSEGQLRELEKTTSAYLEKKIEKFLWLCKKNKVDPIGLGDLVRSQSKKWSAQDFEDVYSEIKTKISVQVKMVQHGIGE
ncbi:Ger(x)C family spore germination protein [Cohnella luojiensis]|uniref:Ger(X)C family spore germination protein n=1 Tax=Cohnella luojiensis TaxID=652876 RepID=A0A4Y8LRP2_9BACL|nr:Ger(x)C family spore germination protein [Cohnella luojiensis]TFE22698.1 Ger(x)C family spore germination protein [Cohnella luojiensis]